MEVLVVLLTVMPLTWGAEFQKIAEEKQRFVSSQVVNTIEDIKKQMPCGFPEYDIPPLAPYQTDYQEFNINLNNTKIFGEVTNFSLHGLNDIDILKLNINVFLSRGYFKFNWNNVFLTTNYNTLIVKDGKAVTRSGPAKFSLKNLTVWGVIKYHLGLISNKVTVKEIRVYISLEEVKSEIEGLSKISIVNKKLNRFIEEWVMITVKDNSNNLAELTNNKMVPVINDILGDMTLSDLLDMIGGGGGGEAEEKEPCVPPQGLGLNK